MVSGCGDLGSTERTRNQVARNRPDRGIVESCVSMSHRALTVRGNADVQLNPFRLLVLAATLAAGLGLACCTGPRPDSRAGRDGGAANTTSQSDAPIPHPERANASDNAAQSPRSMDAHVPGRAPPGTVVGRVVDEQGDPISCASIYVAVRAVSIFFVPESRPATAITDQEGNFTVEGLSTESSFECRFVADHPDYLRGESAVVRPGCPEKLSGIQLRLQKAARLQGVVQGAQGQRLVGARVEVTPIKRQGVFPPGTSLSDCEGEFSVCQLPPGEVRIRVSADGHRDFQGACILPLGLVTRSFTLDRGLTIPGRVTDRLGNGVAGAEVWATTAQPPHSTGAATTDDNGHYAISGLRKGEYRLAVSAPGYAAETEMGTAAGEGQVNFVLRANGAISGRVTAASHGTPVPEFCVLLKKRQENGEYQLVREFRHISRTGQFDEADLESGTYSAVVRARGFLDLSHTGIIVREGVVTSGLVLALKSVPRLDRE